MCASFSPWRAPGLSAAARVLGVGHVTVGRRIALFEARLGVTLLSRTPDGFTTTSAGEAVLRQCTAMENAALDLERVAVGRDTLVTGSVRVTTTEALAHQLVAPAIAMLRQRYPELRIDLIAGVRSLDIARRDADLAVRFARPRRQVSCAGSSEKSASPSTHRHGIWRERESQSDARDWPVST